MFDDFQQVVADEIACIKRDKDSLLTIANAVAVTTQNPDIISTNRTIKPFHLDIEQRLLRLEELFSAVKLGDLAKVTKLYVEILEERDRPAASRSTLSSGNARARFGSGTPT